MINVYRDPQRTMADVASLWAMATNDGLDPFQWHMGFFTLRDILDAKFAGYRTFAANQVRAGAPVPRLPRLVSLWGGTVHVVDLGDFLQLLARKGNIGKTYRL